MLYERLTSRFHAADSHTSIKQNKKRHKTGKQLKAHKKISEFKETVYLTCYFWSKWIVSPFVTELYQFFITRPTHRGVASSDGPQRR